MYNLHQQPQSEVTSDLSDITLSLSHTLLSTEAIEMSCTELILWAVSCSTKHLVHQYLYTAMKIFSSKLTPRSHRSTHSLSQLWGELVKDKVWKCLRHCANIGNVVSHYSVGESEASCRAIRQVAHHQTICMCTCVGGCMQIVCVILHTCDMYKIY